MSGAPSDSYAHGLFRTASEGNISRRYKALQRKAAGTLSRPPSAPRKPPASPKRDRVAELLSRGMDFETNRRVHGHHAQSREQAFRDDPQAAWGAGGMSGDWE